MRVELTRINKKTYEFKEIVSEQKCASSVAINKSGGYPGNIIVDKSRIFFPHSLEHHSVHSDNYCSD